jgi:hypothetical protein
MWVRMCVYVYVWDIARFTSVYTHALTSQLSPSVYLFIYLHVTCVCVCVTGKLSLLSLAYCDIGWDGGIHLCDIISLKQNSIKSANFEGNDLGSEGMTALAVGIAHADCLTTLNIAQNKFSDDLKMIDALARAFHRNKTLAHINIDGNLIGNDGCKYFVEFLNECTHILSFDITPFVGPIHFFALTEWLGRNKPKKGKKGGKKKKKKGK